MKVAIRSLVSGAINHMELDVTQEQLDRWENGELVQNVMPHLTADEREFLISGCTSAEFESLWPEE
jgi:hypothetical protein